MIDAYSRLKTIGYGNDLSVGYRDGTPRLDELLYDVMAPTKPAGERGDQIGKDVFSRQHTTMSEMITFTLSAVGRSHEERGIRTTLCRLDRSFLSEAKIRIFELIGCR
jgi:hypothetical protein